MNRFLSKDFLSGLLFIGFGLLALYFGQKLALGTPVRMGPGYVPRMLSLVLLGLGFFTSRIVTTYSRETMNLLAEEHGCLVLYPEQADNAKHSQSWKCFDGSHQGRDGDVEG